MYGTALTEAIKASAAAKRHETILLTELEVEALLTQLGMVCAGPDPDQRDLNLWHQPHQPLFISLPSRVSGPDLARTIWHAGAREARRQIREARERYLHEVA